MTEKENFLRRWSRLKRELPPEEPMPAAAASAVPAPAAPAELPLPAPESLEFSSDFTAFMQDEVSDGLRRAALQKLFHTEHFNVMDGLDVYIDDYNSFEPIGAELLSNLNQTRGLLFDEEPLPAAGDASEAASAATAAATDPGEPPVPPAIKVLPTDGIE